MLVHFGLESVQPEWHQCVACIGTFDGIHLGHRALIEDTVRRAEAMESPSVVVTFDRHPLSVLRPDDAPLQIQSLSQNLRQIAAIGVAATVVLPFDARMAATPAQAFYDDVLVGALRVVHCVVGHDFAFGQRRVGTPDWLAERMPSSVMPPVTVEGHRVSSSVIRDAISRGDCAEAARQLGRPFEIEGVVVTGQKLGRTIGYPTLNLARMGERLVTPANGIYGGRCTTRLGEFKAAISVGVRPTVGGEHRTIEAYLLDYPGEPLYGSAVRLTFDHRVRDELKFDSLEALRTQIEADVAEIDRLVAFTASRA